MFATSMPAVILLVLLSVDHHRVSCLEQADASAQIGAVVGDDLLWHSDAPGQTLQASLDVGSGAVGSDAQIKDDDLMMLQGTGASPELFQRNAKDQQAFLLADADRTVENPHPVIARGHIAAEQEQATTQQPGADRLVVGEAQRQRIAEDADETEEDFADAAQADVGVEIPKQAEADDQDGVAVTFRRRQLSRRQLPAARACVHLPWRRKCLACLFELESQRGDLLGLLPGDRLPVIAAFGEIPDGDAKFLQRPLLVRGTLLPDVPAAAKQPDQTRWRTLELWF